jgi:hypothetical protein
MQNIPPPSRFDRPASYRITVQGRLDPGWAEWFDGLTVTVAADETGAVCTCLTGPVFDQGALHGLLARVRDLGLPLLEVRRLEAGLDSGPASGDTKK